MSHTEECLRTRYEALYPCVRIWKMEIVSVPTSFVPWRGRSEVLWEQHLGEDLAHCGRPLEL